MAAIEQNRSARHKPGIKKMMKKSTRVDLTPMVDLGFLLITFFVFTSTMCKATVMNVVMPYDKTTENDPVCQSCVLTIIPDQNNSIAYYEGRFTPTALLYSSYNNLRHLIQQKKQKLAATWGNTEKLVLIIKPSPKSTFKNFVDIVDEATINCVKRYYIGEITGEETLALINTVPLQQ
ncbi:MAG TPA: biopolymer transporter ExbD [Ferruginibacter sp.]|nr:biopolymer transporter ExbD [Ferruginibacter sp.]HMP20205.1 biopolymer transporter ExbD [Ferruginibacter sp.]